MEDDDRLLGLDVDLAQLLSNSMGVELEIVDMPFAKLLPALEDGDVDMVMSGVTAAVCERMLGPGRSSRMDTPRAVRSSRVEGFPAISCRKCR